MEKPHAQVQCLYHSVESLVQRLMAVSRSQAEHQSYRSRFKLVLEKFGIINSAGLKPDRMESRPTPVEALDDGLTTEAAALQEGGLKLDVSSNLEVRPFPGTSGWEPAS